MLFQVQDQKRFRFPDTFKSSAALYGFCLFTHKQNFHLFKELPLYFFNLKKGDLSTLSRVMALNGTCQSNFHTCPLMAYVQISHWKDNQNPSSLALGVSDALELTAKISL